MKLDHLVYFTKENPKNTVEEQQKKRRNAIIGGSHKQWGTRNVLLYTQSAYIEWLSVENQKIAHNSDHPLTQQLTHDLKDREGWGTLCISVENIEQFREDLKKKDFKVSKIFDAKRKTPEGDLLRWKMLFVDKPSLQELPFPFFIEWEEPEETRRDRLKEKDAIKPSNENIQLKECVIATENPKEEIKVWENLLSHKPSENRTLYLPNINLRFIKAKEGSPQRLREVLEEN